MDKRILNKVKTQTPLVHLITNYVTANDCANAVLAVGGSPVMADEILEVDEIVSLCSALVLNLGTLNQRTVNSMFAAGRKANQLRKPVILDPVGVGATKFRTQIAKQLLEEIQFSVIKGNISEMKALATGQGSTRGVDASTHDLGKDLGQVIALAHSLWKDTESVIVISGAKDIITNGKRTHIIENGQSIMAQITGTGCMLSSIIGGLVGATPEQVFDSTVTATALMGVSGDLALEKLNEIGGGPNTYRSLLIDYLTKVDGALLERRAKIEVR